MEPSKLIAKIASVIYLSAGVGAFLSADYYRNIAADMFGNAGLTFLAGFMTVIIGFLIVYFHNTWVKNWTVLITIIGWLALFKGIILIVCPQFIRGISETMLAGQGTIIFPYTAFCLGLLFAYFGFLSRNPSTDKPD